MRELVVSIGGVGGDGVLWAGDAINHVLLGFGFRVSTYNSFPSRIRGGHTSMTLRANLDRLRGRADASDILLAFDEETVELHAGEVKPAGLVILDSKGEDFEASGRRGIKVPLSELSKEATGKKTSKNAVGVGALMAAVGIPGEDSGKVFFDAISAFNKAMAELNLKAFQAGYNYISSSVGSVAKLETGEKGDMLMLSGNDAFSLGALAGGCRFEVAYPITPASDILHFLAKDIKSFGGVCVQSEDEIAAVTMAIGASYAGVRAMTSSSGPGIALMSEAMGLCAMAEIPLVIVNAMRGGPSTGLPTRTAQADVWHSLFTGHGDAPRVVLAPGTVEESFELAWRAFNIAEKYQTLVIVLTDQYLAMNNWTTPPFDLSGVNIERGGLFEKTEGKFERYAVTDTGVSPRAIPGMPGGVFLCTGNEHLPDGHISEDPENAKAMQQKRLRKFQTMQASGDLPKTLTEGEGDVHLVYFGSMELLVDEALESVKQGITRHRLRTLWPLPDLRDRLKGAKRVLFLEQNAQGQLGHMLLPQLPTGAPARFILKYDGRPYRPGRLAKAIEKEM